ncbi:MAG: 5,6-dimethylbenzimidazole synthase [Acidimicrobiales bacterium]
MPAPEDGAPQGGAPRGGVPEGGVYATIGARRDVRQQFSGAAVDPAALWRILTAAHGAPSVGLSQPWDFVLVRDEGARRAFADHVRSERQVFAAALPEERRVVFEPIKIEGILEASLGIVVTYDPRRGAPHVLGRHSISDAGLYSVCLAIENLWLAATVEGWGIGWVSFYREPFLQSLVELPREVRPVAWLCAGPVTHLAAVPDLEAAGWRSRRPLGDALHLGSWAGASGEQALARWCEGGGSACPARRGDR